MRIVVPTERHVERLLRATDIAETRATLRERLFAALAPDVTLATREESRLALSVELPAIATRDALLGGLLARDGAGSGRGAPMSKGAGAWLRAVAAVDDAIGALHACAVDSAMLAAAVRREGGALSSRARLLGDAMDAQRAALARRGLLDPRCLGRELALVLARETPERVRDALGDARVVAKWIVVWEASDLAWWRALDLALRSAGGSAVIRLPAIESALEPSRNVAPLERVLDELARGLDDAPETSPIAAPLGDLRMDGKLEDKARVEIHEAVDARAQARAIADCVRAALSGEASRSAAAQLDLAFGGRKRAAPIESIAIALPQLDEETLAPIRAALDEARIPAHEPRGLPTARSGAVALALDALSLASRGLPRRAVASLLRSTYVDIAALMEIVAPEEQSIEDASRLANEVARALDETATMGSNLGDDAVATLEATARAPARCEDAAARAHLARSLGEVLSRSAAAATRVEHIAGARALWSSLGIGQRVHAALRAIRRDDPPVTGIARAELTALARDAHAWAALMTTVDEYEAAVLRLDTGAAPVSAEAFRHELTRALDAGTASPGAARAGAIRIARLGDLAGEPLDLLIVVDANEGVLPSNVSSGALLSEALVARLRERSPAHAPPTAQLRASRELAALAAAASRAERVAIVYRLRDDGGAALAPAPLVTWLERAHVMKTRWGGSPTSAVLTPADAHLAALAVATEDDARVRAPEASRRARIERARESFFESEHREPSEIVGRLAASAAIVRVLTEETGGADRALSVTGLERIATCGFQGFASVALRADEPRARAEMPDPREGGTLLHAALAAAFLATTAQWSQRPRPREAITRRALEACDAVIGRARGASVLRGLMLDRIRENVSAVIAWSLDEDDWDFILAEQAFGDGRRGSWPSLRLEGDDGVVLALRGSIDRVDSGHRRSAARAIDYKSSERGARAATKQLGQTTFQVALYAKIAASQRAAAESFGTYLPAHAASLPPRKRRMLASAKAWASANESIEGRPRAEALALDVVRAIRGGAVAPLPIDKSACETCAFDGGCRKPRFVIRGTSSEESG